MKTDELIAMLGTNVEPVDHRRVSRTLGIAVGLGIVAALIGMIAALGIRTDFGRPSGVSYLPLTLVFALSVVVLTSIALTRLARPGGERSTPIAFVTLPFIAIVLLAALSLGTAPRSHWYEMIFGDHWLQCLIAIPTIAIAPFAIVVSAVRRMAPTDLVRTGAMAGLVAGGISATAYALHFTDDSLPFVALWYGGTIALCTLAGALLGPRLLRW